MNRLRDFYNGKRIFLTGHTGFKGSWMSLLLAHLGAEVHGFALPPVNMRGNLFEHLAIGGRIARSTYGDIRDADALEAAMAAARPDIVLHMAAQPLVRASYRDPLETWQTNILGTVHLFEAIRRQNTCRTVLNITTDKCYENSEWIWPYRENDRLGGHDPYSASKACAELVTTSYRRSFFADSGIHLASARAGNVIGGGDFSQDRLIPDIVESVMRGEMVTLRSPDAIRPWQHVIEVVSGYLMLAARLHTEGARFATAYNFGPDDLHPITVEALTRMFISTLGRGEYRIERDDRLHETLTLRLDNSQIKHAIGWRPRYTQEEAIQLTADWFGDYFAKADMHAVTLRQITQYLDLSGL
jgi:CDP-glucose 4,6-dehydratase